MMRSWLSLLCGLLVWTSTTSSTSLLAAADELTFEQHIRPLLKARCFNCHGEGTELAGQLDVRLVRVMKTGGDGGPALIPGKRAESPLYQRIQSGEMPPDGLAGFTPAQVELIGRWIDAGAPTRRAESEAADAASGITPEDREFWSFQPVSRPSIPAVQRADWPRTAIDRFVLQTLESQGLTPAVEADPRTRLRRLSYVTVGLPAEPAVLEQILEDPTDARYVAEVDRLLASPQYGERWGRVWLDLVRYADQAPRYVDKAERAWLYRDWVIRSLNADRSYREFLTLQLAADQLPDVDPTDKAALGMLGLSPVYWKELQLAPSVIESIVADEWDERIDAITRTFLGLTVSCARCHNHKFDPVTVEDYYALAGVVASTSLAEVPLLPEADAAVVQKARSQVQKWAAELEKLKDPSSALIPVLNARIARLEAATPRYFEPWAHGVQDASTHVLPDGAHRTKIEQRPGMSQDLAIFRRGDPTDRGPVVSRRFLEVLSQDKPVPFQQGSGRAELAQAILNDGGPLAARVIVNRLWAQVFGRGIVSTTSDFGRQGEPPTHPELLDYLAARLIESDWQLKPVLREMLLSSTFQQSSQVDAATRRKDPDGRLLSRFARRRLDVEPWRDTLMTAAGVLDDRMYGVAEPFSDASFVRRSLYGKVVRDELDTMMRLYDFPEASGHSPHREPTSTPLQQLAVLNGTLFQKVSTTFAASLSSLPNEPDRVDAAYQRLLQRPPSERERSQALQFLQQLRSESKPGTTVDPWPIYLQVLLGLNEVLFLE